MVVLRIARYLCGSWASCMSEEYCFVHFGSAGSHRLSWSKYSVSVWMLNRVAHIVTAACRDL